MCTFKREQYTGIGQTITALVEHIHQSLAQHKLTPFGDIACYIFDVVAHFFKYIFSQVGMSCSAQNILHMLAF